MSFSKCAVVLAMSALYLTGCASGVYKERQEQREKLSSSSGLFCEFVNGEQHPDIDVELNMQMAKRCDINKHFVISNYRTSSEMNGIMYCCQNSPKQARANSGSKNPVAAGKESVKTPPAAEKSAPSEEIIAE